MEVIVMKEHDAAKLNTVIGERLEVLFELNE